MAAALVAMMAKRRPGVRPPDWSRPPGPDRPAHETFLNTSEALVPPKPKLLDSATSIFIGLALCGTRSSGVSTEGLSRLMRRRRDLVAHGQHREGRLDRAGGAQQMADRRLGRRHRDLARRLAQQPLDRAELDLVAQRRRGAVGVDVVDVGRVDARMADRRLHGAEAAVAVLGRRGDVVGVAGEAIADDLGVDLRAARLGVLVAPPAPATPAPSPITKPSRSLS